jgi:hypothetical protein
LLTSDDSTFVTGSELFVDGGAAQIWSPMRCALRLFNKRDIP